MAKAEVADLLEANKALRYVKANPDLKLNYEDMPPLEKWRLGVYTDASWATRPDGSSQGGSLIFVEKMNTWKRVWLCL